MEIEKIFGKLAEYLEFTIDFLMLRGLERFARLGSISPDLLFFCIVGTLFAVYFHFASGIPDFSIEATPSSATGSTDRAKLGGHLLERGQLVIFIPMLVVGAILAHVSLLVCTLRGGLEIGSFKDSLNATLATGAVGHPILVLATRLGRFGGAVRDVSRGAASAIATLSTLASVAVLGYYFHAIAVVHRVTLWRMVWPLIVFFVLAFMLAIAVAYFLGLWTKGKAMRAKTS